MCACVPVILCASTLWVCLYLCVIRWHNNCISYYQRVDSLLQLSDVLDVGGQGLPHFTHGQLLLTCTPTQQYFIFVPSILTRVLASKSLEHSTHISMLREYQMEPISLSLYGTPYFYVEPSPLYLEPPASYISMEPLEGKDCTRAKQQINQQESESCFSYLYCTAHISVSKCPLPGRPSPSWCSLSSPSAPHWQPPGPR